MGKAAAWACGYLLTLAWDFAGLAIVEGSLGVGGDSESNDMFSGGSLAVLLVLIAAPALLARALSGQSRRAIQCFGAGLLAGTFMVVAWFVVVALSLLLLIGWILPIWNPITLAVFFCAPPLYFGWLAWIHASASSAKNSD